MFFKLLAYAISCLVRQHNVDVLTKLEEVTAMRIPAIKVQPKDMDTVSLMLSTARRVRKPKS
jgi:hypothetical protein